MIDDYENKFSDAGLLSFSTIINKELKALTKNDKTSL